MRLADVVRELSPVQTKPENRHADDRLAPENDPVLTKTVVGGGGSGEVPGAVDLDNEADVGPGDVEVDAAVGQLPHRLTGGRRETATTAHRREVQLAERVRPARDRRHSGRVPCETETWMTSSAKPSSPA